MQTEVISSADDLAALFNIFHDGIITEASFADQDLELNVRISYLAQRIAPDFRTFAVRFAGVEDVSFETWPKDSTASREILKDISAIFYPHLDILSGESSNGYIHVVCNQPSSATPHCGGTLRFRSTSAVVCDQNRKPYALIELEALARAYWDDWSKRNSTA